MRLRETLEHCRRLVEWTPRVDDKWWGEVLVLLGAEGGRGLIQISTQELRRQAKL